MPANPTPSLAGTAETMTPADVKEMVQCEACYEGCQCTHCAFRSRILATYAALAEKRAAYTLPDEMARLRSEVFDLTTALAEKTAECERLREALVSVMAHMGRSGADGHTHNLALANGLLDSVARIASTALDAARPHATPEGE